MENAAGREKLKEKVEDKEELVVEEKEDEEEEVGKVE